MSKVAAAKPSAEGTGQFRRLAPENWKEMVSAHFADEGRELYSIAGFKGEALEAKAKDFAQRAIDYCSKETTALLETMSKDEIAVLYKHPDALTDAIGIYLDDFCVQEGLKLLNRNAEQIVKIANEIESGLSKRSTSAYIR
ncbi:MAG: hypothetical protein KGH57_01065 [Candidatus Micrarchaeota archaeon]|nr:hypothetical protein [Candidatus Micrarchaeota archaeon]